MEPNEIIDSGTAHLYCPQCKTTTVVKWYGKLAMKRCWRCDSMLEEEPNER